MTGQSAPIDAALDGVRRVQFETADILRRAQGRTFQAVGFGPDECSYRVVASGPFWVLRDYGKDGATQCVLIVAAPIKRPYIWDLAPSSSAIRYCLKEGLRVRLLEWLPDSRTTGANGLAEYAQAIGECVVKISGECQEPKPFLLGHSLGGTLAAIFAAMEPEIHLRTCAARRAAVLPAWYEPIPGRPCVARAVGPGRGRALSGLAPISDERPGVAGYFRLVETHGRGIERRGPDRTGNSRTRRALGSRRSSSSRQIRPSAH